VLRRRAGADVFWCGEQAVEALVPRATAWYFAFCQSRCLKDARPVPCTLR
jgi:hypothetical protein